MIRSFKDKEAEKIFNRALSRKLPNDLQRTALRKLRMLNRAMILNDLRVPPANRLEKMKGDRSDQYSIRINGGFALNGQAVMPLMLKLWIITRVN